MLVYVVVRPGMSDDDNGGLIVRKQEIVKVFSDKDKADAFANPGQYRPELEVIEMEVE